MLLKDSRHKKWLVVFLGGSVAAVGLYVWLGRDVPDGFSGGSRVGLLYGIAGGSLIVFAWLLSALRFVPSWWWLGSRAFWLRGHIWLGSLSFVLILCHSGGRFGGPLEQGLYVAFALTLVTGFFGLGLQQVLPSLLTRRVPVEVPYEQIPHVCAMLRDRADLLVKSTDTGKLPPLTAEHLRAFYDDLARPFLGWPMQSRVLADAGKAAEVFGKLLVLPGLATPNADSPVEKMLGQLATFTAERELLAEQEHLQRWLHGWLYVHILLSAAMLVLGAAHVVMTLYY